MTFEKIVYDALRETGIEVTQRPVTGKAKRYLTWNESIGQFGRYASNRPTRVTHSITVDLFSRDEPLSDDVLAIAGVLMRNGFVVESWGSMDYESDTRWYHIPINAVYADRATE